ncbi:MAG: ABC transporter ATP-binding protein [Lachnospiraceae bacterium]|nr:ABC transporter ATP-binding protein [Lachnospiraceae bacterium]
MIEVKNLVKKYGDHLAVNNLSFIIEPGKIYGFLGPNGAGKSTTMNIITGYLAATEGQVLINGHDIYEEPEAAKKCIGYLPELPPLYMDMTPREYLEFASDLKGIKKSEERAKIDEVVRMTGIEEVFNRLIKNLSKGYKQRVGLAQAILGFPEIIILDEPTVGLDPKQIIEIREVIKKLGKQHTVILSTHIMQEVSAVCDEVMIIAKGELVAKDTPNNLGKHIQGSNTIEALVQAPDYKVKAILNKMEHIHKFEVYNVPEENCVKAVITTGMEYDVRESLFYACAAAKCPIVGMQASEMSLEDVFIKVTGSGSDARKGKTVNVKKGTK